MENVSLNEIRQYDEVDNEIEPVLRERGSSIKEAKIGLAQAHKTYMELSRITTDREYLRYKKMPHLVQFDLDHPYCYLFWYRLRSLTFNVASVNVICDIHDFATEVLGMSWVSTFDRSSLELASLIDKALWKAGSGAVGIYEDYAVQNGAKFRNNNLNYPFPTKIFWDGIEKANIEALEEFNLELEGEE